MKILIFGKNGQVGRACTHLFQQHNIDFVGIGREECNLYKTTDIKTVLNQHSPNVIINAAAYTAVDLAESETENAFQINAIAPRIMAEYAKVNNVFFIHYSTEYVFDGSQKDAYVETDKTNPLNIYGQSKLKGEQNIVSSGCQYVILRTSWVYSAHGKNFVKTILNLAKNKKTIQIVNDQFGSPTSASLLAEATLAILQKYEFDKGEFGLYHFAPKGITNWHEFATSIALNAKAKNIKLELDHKNIIGIQSAEYKTAAQRPKNSTLNTNLFERTFDFAMPLWSDELEKQFKNFI